MHIKKSDHENTKVGKYENFLAFFISLSTIFFYVQEADMKFKT